MQIIKKRRVTKKKTYDYASVGIYLTAAELDDIVARRHLIQQNRGIVIHTDEVNKIVYSLGQQEG